MDVLAPKGLGFLLYGERVERNSKGDLVGLPVGPFLRCGLEGVERGFERIKFARLSSRPL